MITSLLCLAFPLLLIYAAWHDVSTMTIPNWVSITLAAVFVPAAFAAGLSAEQIGWHLMFGAAVLIGCAVLFYLNVFGGGDAKVIAAASLWTGLGASAPFVFGMAIAGGALAGLLIVRPEGRLFFVNAQNVAERIGALVDGLDAGLENVGFIVIGVFIASWLLSAAIYRYKRYDELPVRRAA